MKFLSFLLVSLFSLGALAELQELTTQERIERLQFSGLKYFKKITRFKSHDLVLMVEERNRKDVLLLYDNESKKVALEHSADLASQAYVQAFFFFTADSETPLLLGSWQHGAHGEQILIWQKKGDKWEQVWEKTSSWPFTIQQLDESLKIQYSEEVGEGAGENLKEKTIFYPPVAEIKKATP